MARLTRNSYKRKIILFGLFVFVSIALISTGFAAWVMSSDAKTDADGNLSVGVVSDSSLKIVITNEDYLKTFNFMFEPVEIDNTGAWRYDGENSEVLSVDVEGTISNIAVLAEDGLTIEMTLPDGMEKAIELGYIVAPSCTSLTEDGTLVAHPQVITVTPDGKGGGTFTYELKFTWGTAFGGVNPALYFDGHALEGGKIVNSSDQSGLKYSDDEAKVFFEKLRACVFDYYDDLEGTTGDTRAQIIAEHEDDELPKFHITIKAVAN